jgi:gas vesicle protein
MVVPQSQLKRIQKMSMSSSLGKFISGIFLGGLLGLLIGMLLSSRSGKETRELIKDNLNERCKASSDVISSKSEQLQASVKAKASALSEKLSDLSSELEDAGKKAFNRFTRQNAKETGQEVPSPIVEG